MLSTRDRLNRHVSLRGSRGFTLTELMVTLTIFAILLTIGIPSYRSVTTSNRISSEVNGLLGDLQYARAEAIKQGQTVTVCSSSDGASCAASTSWARGWIVFGDPNASRTVDANEPVYKAQTTFNSTDTFLADNNVSAVSFNREGFAFGLPATVTVTLHEASGTSVRARCLQITVVGMLAAEKPGVGACL
jgi:type IV fimbrial biogenesis protein FimT